MKLTREQKDKRLGALFGQAIGDALGVRDEFKPAAVIEAESRDRLVYKHSARTDESDFGPGEWSDDTEQALCILDAFIKDGEIVPQTLAQEMLDWLTRDGRGCGSHTMLILNDGLFSLEPLAVSETAWENSGRRAAANGAAMRVSVVGILRPEDLDWTEKMAAISAQVTHFDPRCVASAVAIAIAVAMLVQGSSITKAIKEAEKRASRYHPESTVFMQKSLTDLQLDEGLSVGKWNTKAPIGYTYKTLGAGFWALRNFAETADFGQSLDPILAAGGDVDTNAAVAGALIGAALGVSKMPAHLVHEMPGKDKLLGLARQVFARIEV